MHFLEDNAGPITISGLAAGHHNGNVITRCALRAVSKTLRLQVYRALDITETHTETRVLPATTEQISVTATGGWPDAYAYELVAPTALTCSAQTRLQV
jgi:hypothetical protein